MIFFRISTSGNSKILNAFKRTKSMKLNQYIIRWWSCTKYCDYNSCPSKCTANTYNNISHNCTIENNLEGKFKSKFLVTGGAEYWFIFQTN